MERGSLMKYKMPGKHHTVDEFRAHLQALDPATEYCDTRLEGPDGPLAQPLELRGRVLANRFVAHPMEGWDGTRDGRPTERTLRRWRHFGTSGAKLIWGGEAFAVQEDGRANPHQLFRNADVDVVADLVRLREAACSGHRDIGEDAEELAIGLQLTHSGRFARPDDDFAPRLPGRHPILDARLGEPLPALLSDAELDSIGASFVATARLAQAAGFEFVDIKCCHGYLLHELLSARTRGGVYGGSFDNRTRLFHRIVEAIRAECPGLGIVVRVSIADIVPHEPDEQRVGRAADRDGAEPYRHGFGVDQHDPGRFDLDEPMRFLELLRDLDIRLVNVTLGSPYYCPHLQRPAGYPPSDGYLPPEDPLLSVIRHLRVTRECKRRFPEMRFVGTGYSYLQEWLGHVAQHEVRCGHVDLVGIGRMLLSYPDMLADILRGKPLARERICRTFSDCTTSARHGLASGCYPLDPYYKALPEAGQLKAIKKKARSDGES